MAGTAAIIGGGVIGGGWAARFLLNGWDVRVFDPDPEATRKIGEVLDNARNALPMLYDFALPDEGKLSFHPTMSEAVAGAEWIQESVPERLELKRKVYQTLQEHCDANAVIGSSTSGFKPSELQGCATRPDQIVVTHPFNPVYLLPLIELVTTDRNPSELINGAKETLTSLGLYPLHVKKEIDAHIADRFLEAVWREALWLIKDGIATTEEIDNAIRYGFGIRWAQMGLFETYRVAGGEAGMKHFIDQFGPCLQWPWTKLMDVPELTDELAQMIADQSDAQSGHLSIRELERKRDGNLIAMMRALRQQDNAAGRLINEHQAGLRPVLKDGPPIISARRVIPIDWTDYNGHMNEGRYGQLFSDAADAIMTHVGADDAYIAAGNSYFTAETNIKFLSEAHAGEKVVVESLVTQGEGKKLRCYHEMKREADGEILATSDQFMLHVNLESRRSCDPLPEVLARVEALAALHKEN
ncbi:L-carnitine dehydrogenase [Roseovarius litorisediminis]|uniref:L-carnitine dehydrogenase n=1 Tax=Roseovarius litorisediminis TaxID=1312363 RepID=A0A1Y5T008_9RHOB|nr:carnitine 3-dehydrogenase [Roseovarius litorisediminis]SLN52550.1 L-carnitine dehydrogenase [Roseovarius litorisediminis]